MPIRCLVCGAENAKQHYGFFWRSVSSKRRYICLSVGSEIECTLEDGRRNCCRACRLKRCLKVGMDPKLIRDCWGKSASPQGPLIRDRCQSLGQPPVYKSDRESVQPDTCTDFDGGVQQQTEDPPKAPIYCNQNVFQPQNKPKVSAFNLQLLSDYLEWVHNVPELNLLTEDDRNLMVLRRARPSAWLLLAHHEFNNFKNRAQVELDKLELLHNEIIGPLRELDAQSVEVEILRNVCFFSTVPQLSETGRGLVNSVQNANLRALSEFALSQTGLLDKLDETPPPPLLLLNTVFRLNRMVNILSVVEKIAHLNE
uniref:Nuclear receptor domain-containing protein n=1 Tax=Globodera pallida TaxID=36090 RepID=A0A183CGN1_GLOPA